MALNTGGLMPIDEALDYILAQVSPAVGVEELPLAQALGCVLAQAQVAQINVPEHDNSAMDGFVLRCADLQEGRRQLPISQVIAAGHVGEPLEPGTAARIFTGAPIPAGADTVVIQENAEFDENFVSILEQPELGRNIRLKGHDIAKGGQVLDAGHRLRSQDMGLLSSLGISRIQVKRPLTIAIINTGDEIVPPDQVLKAGQIYDSNSYTLDALLQQLGFRTLKLGIVADDLESTEKALKAAASQADCVITTGGVSVGDEDHVRKAVENLGELALWKLAIKPGKPFSFGRVSHKPFFGLPGNPVAVFVTFVMLVRPYLLKVQGAKEIALTEFKIKSGFDMPETGSRQEYIRVKLHTNASGEQELLRFGNQGSSIMTSLSWADGLAIIPIDTTVSKGKLLRYIPFAGLV